MIIHAVTKLDVGGAQTIVEELALYQLNRGERVLVITGLCGAVGQRLSSSGVEVLVIPELQRSADLRLHHRSLNSLRETLKGLPAQPAIVHAHSSNAGLVARSVCSQLGLPVVYTAHGWPFQPGAPLVQRALSYGTELHARRHGAHVVCVSQEDYDRTLRGRVCPADRLHLVQNGLGTPTSNPTFRHGERHRPGLHIVMVARFAVPKRQDVLVRSLALLADDVRLTLVGDGRQQESIRALSNELTPGRVQFLSNTDPSPVLDDADVFVLLSDYEGLSISVLEAMQQGLPIVTNDFAGLKGVIENGKTGLIVKKTPQSVATAIDSLRDPAYRQALGIAAHQRWSERFTRAQMGEDYEKVYSQLLK